MDFEETEKQVHYANGALHHEDETGLPIIENWYYPPDVAGDLKNVDLPAKTKAEVLAMSWEYARSVIPQYTNWKRYVAFQRIFIMGIIAEFRGDLVDIVAGDEVLGYNMQEVLDDLFEGTAGQYVQNKKFDVQLQIC